MANHEPTGRVRPIPPQPMPAGPQRLEAERGRRVPRPDPRPLRTLVGFAGFAALSAFGTAILLPTSGTSSTATVSSATVVVEAVPEPSVVLVTRYVHLEPGQTAPPFATVQDAPAPTPRTIIVTTTRQSGRP
jgi:hypothetical protein